MSVRLTALALLTLTAGCDEGTLEASTLDGDTNLADVEAGPTGTDAGDEAGDEAAVDPMVIDLGENGETSWYAVNDTVMGGVSEGVVDYTNNSLIFEGEVSTANNGGFTSVRSPSGAMDLRAFDEVVVRVKSEGQPFTLILADSPNWWEGQFRYDLDVSEPGWNEVVIDMKSFEFYDFSTGYPVPTGEMMRRPDRKDILFLEFQSELFEDGEFRLEVDHITFQ